MVAPFSLLFGFQFPNHSGEGLIWPLYLSIILGMIQHCSCFLHAKLGTQLGHEITSKVISIITDNLLQASKYRYVSIIQVSCSGFCFLVFGYIGPHVMHEMVNYD